jgi:hypothetical protein
MAIDWIWSMHKRCWNIEARTQMLEHQCWNTDVETQMLELMLKHSAVTTETQ